MLLFSFSTKFISTRARTYGNDDGNFRRAEAEEAMAHDFASESRGSIRCNALACARTKSAAEHKLMRSSV